MKDTLGQCRAGVREVPPREFVRVEVIPELARIPSDHDLDFLCRRETVGVGRRHRHRRRSVGDRVDRHDAAGHVDRHHRGVVRCRLETQRIPVGIREVGGNIHREGRSGVHRLARDGPDGCRGPVLFHDSDAAALLGAETPRIGRDHRDGRRPSRDPGDRQIGPRDGGTRSRRIGRFRAIGQRIPVRVLEIGGDVETYGLSDGQGRGRERSHCHRRTVGGGCRFRHGHGVTTAEAPGDGEHRQPGPGTLPLRQRLENHEVSLRSRGSRVRFGQVPRWGS